MNREDKGQFLNLPLINTLRDNGGKDFFGMKGGDVNATKTSKGGAGGEEDSQEKDRNAAIETIPNPPTFYQ